MTTAHKSPAIVQAAARSPDPAATFPTGIRLLVRRTSQAATNVSGNAMVGSVRASRNWAWYSVMD